MKTLWTTLMIGLMFMLPTIALAAEDPPATDGTGVAVTLAIIGVALVVVMAVVVVAAVGLGVIGIGYAATSGGDE